MFLLAAVLVPLLLWLSKIMFYPVRLLMTLSTLQSNEMDQAQEYILAPNVTFVTLHMGLMVGDERSGDDAAQCESRFNSKL